MTAKDIRIRYYMLSGAHTLAASLIWGVNTLFLLDSGLDILEVFTVNAVFTAAMTLFEIPTGAVADGKGRRVSLRWSSLMLFAGTLGYLAAGTWGGGFPAFVAASAVLGLGFTFFSGAAEAWAVDELKYMGETGTETSLFSSAATASSMMMLFGTVSGGLLGSIDYRIPYILRGLLFLVMLLLTCFSMPEKGWKADEEVLSGWERVRRTASDSVKFGWKIPSLRRLMGVSLILGIFMMWGFYALQPYITDLAGFPGAAWLSGLVTALLTLSQIGGQRLAARVDSASLVGMKLAVAMVIAVLGAVITGLAGLNMIIDVLPFNPAILAGIGMIIMMGSLGYSSPLHRTALHRRATSDKRATIISLDSLVGSGGAIAGQPLLGLVAQRFSIAVGYFIGAGVFLLTEPVLWLFRRSELSGGSARKIVKR